MAGMDLPERAIREQVVSAIHLVVQQARLRTAPGASSQIAEITGIEGDAVLMQDLFAFDYNAAEDSNSPGRLVCQPESRRTSPSSSRTTESS